MSLDKLIEGIATIELLKIIKSSNEGEESLCRDLLNYFPFINSGEHLWFLNLAASIDSGFFIKSISAYKVIEKMKPKSEAERLINLINNKYLFPAQKEMTATHGVRRTFRFMSQEERKEMIIEMCVLMEKLKEISNYVCLGYGGVLGAVRDGRLIDHDDDLDVVIGFLPEVAGSREKAQNLVVDFIKGSLNFHAAPYSDSHVQVFAKKWGVDIFIGMISDEVVYFRPVPRQGIPMNDIFPVSIIELEGIKCRAPANPKKYLEWYYGENWMVPDRYFSF